MNKEYNKIKEFISEDLTFSYSGELDLEKKRRIVEQVELIIDDSIEKSSTRKRIYFLVVEMLQNILRHTEKNKLAKFGFKLLENNCFILTENIIATDHIKNFGGKLDELNELSESPDELKQLYKSILLSGNFGGVTRGIGLIDIIRKSKNKILYNFEQIDEQNSKVSLIVKIDVN